MIPGQGAPDLKTVRLLLGIDIECNGDKCGLFRYSELGNEHNGPMCDLFKEELDTNTVPKTKDGFYKVYELPRLKECKDAEVKDASKNTN